MKIEKIIRVIIILLIIILLITLHLFHSCLWVHISCHKPSWHWHLLWGPSRHCSHWSFQGEHHENHHHPWKYTPTAAAAAAQLWVHPAASIFHNHMRSSTSLCSKVLLFSKIGTQMHLDTFTYAFTVLLPWVVVKQYMANLLGTSHDSWCTSSSCLNAFAWSSMHTNVWHTCEWNDKEQ